MAILYLKNSTFFVSQNIPVLVLLKIQNLKIELGGSHPQV